MTELFIGNATKQVLHFPYRVPERKGVIVQQIPIGGQIKITPYGTNTDLSLPDIDAILHQHAKYGMVNVTDLDTTKEPFTGICYSIGKPIPVNKLLAALEKDEIRLEQLGVDMRQQAAVAVNNQIEERIGAPLRGLEMSVAEIEPNSGFKYDAKHVAEGVRVTRSEEGMAPQRGGLPMIDILPRGR
jgi:hypothetical protein